MPINFNPHDPKQEWFTPRFVALLTGQHKETIYRDIRRGYLRAKKVKKRWLISKEEIERYLEGMVEA